MGNQIEKRMIWIAIVSLFLFLSLSFRANAAARTGGVDIALECYEETIEGERIYFNKHPELIPGEQVSYVLSVKNRESDVWIRVKVSFEKTGTYLEETVAIDDSWLIGIDTEWVKRGEYWYYKKPLSKGTSVDFCKGICVPDLNYVPEGITFQISAKAEAVQAANVTMNFSMDEPFDGILIEGNAERGDQDEHVSGFQVRYENGAETIVKADGLFDEIEEIMPGDQKQDVVIIKNASQENVLVKLKEYGEQVDDVLLKALHLTIQRNGKAIYDGAFGDNALKNGLVLGTFSAKSEEALNFQVSLPREETNATAFHQIQIAMKFSVEPLKGNSSGTSNWDVQDYYMPEMYKYPDPSVDKGYYGGSWKLYDEENHKWEYWFADGSKAKNGWLYLYNPYSPDKEKNNWFYFDEKGTMQYGWIRTENGNWYFCHEISDGNLGKLKKGWHHDKDDKRDYYLDPVTGIMQTGWKKIGDQYYYFTPLEKTKRQNWFWNTEIGRWLYDFLGYRTYGSMYKKEMTPDSYYVDENGAWNGQDR